MKNIDFDDLNNQEIIKYVSFNDDKFGIFKYPYRKYGLFYRNEKLFGTEFAEKCQDEYIDTWENSERFIITLSEIFTYNNVNYRCDEILTIDELNEKLKDNKICIFIYSNVNNIDVIYFKCKIIRIPQLLGKCSFNDECAYNKGLYVHDLKYDGFYSNIYYSNVMKCDRFNYLNKSINILNNDNCFVAMLPIFKYNDNTYSCTQYLSETQIIEKFDNGIIVAIYDCYKFGYGLVYRCCVTSKEIIKE